MICAAHQIIQGCSNEGRCVGQGMQLYGGEEICIPRFWINMKTRGHLENLNVDGKTILKCILKKWDGSVWTELIWLRIGTSDWLL